MNFYNLTSTQFSAAVILLNLCLSFVLQFAIVWVYKRTHRGLSYSQGFIFTLMMVGIMGTIVMMVVQNNIAGAFALLGAFSLIRFRTIMKETRDIAFIFFALAIGVAVGTSNYAIALISTVFVSVMVMTMTRFNIGSVTGSFGYLLTVTARKMPNLEKMKEVIARYAISYNILQSRSSEDGVAECVFSLKIRNELDSERLINEIKNNPDVTDVELMTTKHSAEY